MVRLCEREKEQGGPRAQATQMLPGEINSLLEGSAVGSR